MQFHSSTVLKALDIVRYFIKPLNNKRIIVLIKVLLVMGCIYLSLHLIFLNRNIDKSIHEQFTALVKLRNQPGMDSAVSRKILAQKRSDINKQIDSLREKRYSDWYGVIGIILAPIIGWLIRNITTAVFKSERINRKPVHNNHPGFQG